jgi:zinc D-Ala-D-Ala carboxypeptidase
MPTLTDHFTWDEVTRSPTAARLGLENQVPQELVNNVYRTARSMEEVRAVLGVPVKVTSWYRCPPLNAAIGGSKTSVHPKGLAVDFQPAGLALETAFRMIAESAIEFDQLIIERTKDGARWIHFGLSEGPMRRQILMAAGDHLGGQMTYRVAMG